MALNNQKCTCTQFVNADPSKKPPSDREGFAHYVRHGPVQPTEGFIKDIEGRMFRHQWYTRFPWLEYSVEKQSAFCFQCRLFALGQGMSAAVDGGQIDTAFTSTGFNNWKKALEKKRGLVQHSDSICHANAFKAYSDFISGKSVDIQLSQEKERRVTLRQQAIHRNRQTLGRIFDVIRFIVRLSLPFRSHDETDSSMNRGVFLELVKYLAANGDCILAEHLNDSAANATYMSPTSQNEMINIIGQNIQRKVARQAKDSEVFAVLMDETTDVSHKEQVAVYVRYVHEHDDNVTVEERLLSLIDTPATTGEALAALLIQCLLKNGLCVENIVGQGYDGGSNMRGASKGVQARIKQLNQCALFTHCYAHNLNRALVNAACDSTNVDVRNLFGVVELLFTFVQGSAARHAYFISKQKEIDPNSVPLHLKGLSETRWNCRASSLRRLSNETVFCATMDTIDHVGQTTTDGSIRGTAAGILASVTTFKFLLSIMALTPVLEAINNVSEFLQSPNIDILVAQQQITALKAELTRLRNEEVWQAAIDCAKLLAQKLDIEPDLPVERTRKISRRLDSNSATETILSPMDRIKINFYFSMIDKLNRELQDRFPSDLTDFAFLDPRHFGALDGEDRVRRLAQRYERLDADVIASQWRLSHSFIPPQASILEVYKCLPATYTQLRFLYKVLLTLPVTTASVERGFSKLTIVKSKLRSTMNQDRLEALMLATVEKDLLLGLDNSALVESFAGRADRRMLLA